MRPERRYRRAAVAVIAAGALLGVTACGDDGGGGGSDDQITLTIHVFGGAGFGYEALIEQYMEDNPGIIVDYQITTDQYDREYRPTLIQQLDAGTAPDIAAIEEQGVGQMMANGDWWVDLAQYGLDRRESDYPAWKWELGFTSDGKLAALGTDVGGLAMCYRTDLFEQAGLPTDREEVGEMWSTWDKFRDVAQRFIDSGVDAAFVDSPNQIYNARLIQEAGNGDGTSYFDRDNNYIAGESPAVRTAFFYMAELYEMGAIGPFENFSEEWFAAMEAGGFATMACPAWMTGVIKDGSGPGNAGNWDIAPLPGVAGNWGGSWLGVTKDSDHPEEAAKLVDYLTSPEGQLGAWKAINNYPSSPIAQQDPSVSELTDDYFNGAPVGQIIADSIAAYKPVYFGALHSAARAAMENVLIAMIQGEYRSADEAFDAFIAAGQEVVDLEG
ncbi:MAG: extracellular solute-binding protein [Micromonosporaceae bacterium]